MLPLGKIQTSLILHSLNHIFRFVQNATANGASSYDTQLRCYDTWQSHYDTAQSAYDNYFGLQFTV